MTHDDAGIGRSMTHDAAGIGRFADHDGAMDRGVDDPRRRRRQAPPLSGL
jgi:hypothetical protein